MSPKKAQASSTITTDYDSELFLPSKWLNLDSILANSVDLVRVLTEANWAPFAQNYDEWFHYAYGEFWFNAKETDDGIVSTIRDREYLIS